MNTTAETSSYEWMQFYEQTVDELSTSSLGFSDATVMATTASPDSSSLSPSGLQYSTSDQHQPKGSSSSSSSSKPPIRRRSRASKKTPTTLLNANASNFRALVQQFTGCPRAPPLSLGTRRGPINLNFAVGGGSQQNSMMSSVSGNDYHYYQQSHQENASRYGQQHQHFYQDGVPSDNVHHDAFFTTSSGRANADHDQMLNGFDMDNISLQPHNDNNSSNSNYFL
ncbi:VQ motif-containing protein [Corchorus olitorius]|uniref:VQ motif-containing protein n=1 Tax=Corchorus olitorius TaxID=93759 RepID=A0A1R3JC79_9ROSI|nr:VQ motif-containing protein [Corchorus olitorius]